MKYSLIIIIIFLTSCVKNYSKSELKKPYMSKGFAYIYNEEDYSNGTIKKKLDNKVLEIAHNKLRPGSLIKITNLKTNESVVLKSSKRFNYPDFYKILITEPVAEKLRLEKNSPIVEIIEVKKNESFIAKKTKIYKEEEKIHNNAPITTVKINNISKNKIKTVKPASDKFYIVIAEFYSKKSAQNLKKRIKQELVKFNSDKMFIKSKKTNKITLLSGPYKSINLMKNDYILLKNFGFEELDFTIND